MMETDAGETTTGLMIMAEQEARTGKLTAKRVTQISQPACQAPRLPMELPRLPLSGKLSHSHSKSYCGRSKKSKHYWLRYVIGSIWGTPA